jgi:BatD DUF11 like domain
LHRKQLIKAIGSFLPFRALIFSFYCLLFQTAGAQVKFSAQASTRDMGKADYVEVQFVVENAKEIANLQPPEFDDFTVIQGPSQSTGMSVINGSMTQYRGVSYLLQPKKTGTLNIKPGTATVDGQQMHSNPIQIQVHNTSGQTNKTPGFAPLPDPLWPAAPPAVEMDEVIRPGENIAEKIHKNFFIKVEVNKTECFLGEPIVATYKLYARLHSDSRVTRHPSLNGFSVYDMVDPSDDRVSVEKLNGKNFSVHIIRKVQLIPLQAGEVTLDPVELDNNIYFIKADAATTKNSGQGLGGLLDRLFEPEVNGTPFTQHIVLESKPVTIHVKPLPDTGKPSDFNGAVGNYSIQASLDSKQVDTGDASNLIVTIKGSGNLPVINAPAINWPSEIESYDVNTKENIEKTVIPLGGSKTYTYSFVPNKPGKYILPPVKLSYFDPVSHSYKSVETDAMQLKVNASARKKSVSPQLIHVQTAQTDWTTYAGWGAAFLLLAATTVFIIRESKKSAALRKEKARVLEELQKAVVIPVVTDPLQEARGLVAAGDYSKFYGSVNRAIWKTVSDKLNLPASELNKLNIAGGLRNRGWSEDDIIQLNNALNECEMKLYTPEYNTSDVQRMLVSAEQICSRLDA